MTTAFSPIRCETHTNLGWLDSPGSSLCWKRWADVMHFTALLGAVAILIACSGGGKAPPLADATIVPYGSSSTECTDEGCVCHTEGATVECGTVGQRMGGYVTCQMGETKCQDGHWGPCSGARQLQVYAPREKNGFRSYLGLSTTGTVCENNPCDPNCMKMADDAGGLDASTSPTVQVTDAGVTLVKSIASTGAACTTLSVSPPTTTLTITALTSPPTATGGNVTGAGNTNKVLLTAGLSPCTVSSPSVLWGIDLKHQDTATISSSGLLTLVGNIAGPITVTAYAGTLTATATINVRVNNYGSPATAGTLPTGATATNFATTTGSADGSRVIYPYDNTVMPLGLGAPLLQWTNPTAANGGVEITLRYPAIATGGTSGTAIFSYSILTPENNSLTLAAGVPLAAGPRFQIPQAAWTAFEQTVNENRSSSGVVSDGTDTGVIVLQRRTATGTTGAALAELVPANTPRIKFAAGQLKGKVYYQSYASNLIQNYPATCPGSGCTYSPQTYNGNVKFGAATLSINPGQTSSTPTVIAGANGVCRVCHSASSDGSRLVTNLDYNPGGGTGIWDGESILFKPGIDIPSGGTAFPGSPDAGKYSYGAIYKDGSFLFSNTGPSGQNNGGYGYYRTAPYPGGLLGGAGDIQSKLYSLADATLGQVITPHYGTSTGAFPSTLRTATPVFSPDGTMLAFNHYAGTVGSFTGDQRSLAVMDFDVGTKTFSNLRQVVTEPNTACSTASDRPGATVFKSADATPKNITDPCLSVWPAFLPGNEGIVFEREVVNNTRIDQTDTTKPDYNDFGGTRAGCDHASNACRNSGTRAELWWVSLGTGNARHRLDNANGLGMLPTLATDPALGTASAHDANNEPVLNYEPTVLPQTVGSYYWAAFTSRRLYGNVATVNPWWSDPRWYPIGGQYGPTTKKIWITAIDGQPTAGDDPSHPAFYLPNQELLAANSKAYWVADACVTASATRSAATQCKTDYDCCGGGTTSYCSLDPTTVASGVPTLNCIPMVSSGSCVVDTPTPASPASGDICPAGNTNTVCICTSDAQCCGYATGSHCINSQCQKPPSVYADGTFTRLFVSDCPTGTVTVWQDFQWQAAVPTGTTIDFTATSSNSQTDLNTLTAVNLGTATPANTPNTTTWTDINTGNNYNPLLTVDSQLRTQGQVSGKYLQVKMLMHASAPNGGTNVAPTLKQWQVIYDCPDGE